MSNKRCPGYNKPQGHRRQFYGNEQLSPQSLEFQRCENACQELEEGLLEFDLEDFRNIEGVDINQLQRDLETDINCLDVDENVEYQDDDVDDAEEMNFNINFGIMDDRDFDAYIARLQQEEDDLMAELEAHGTCPKQNSPTPRAPAHSNQGKKPFQKKRSKCREKNQEVLQVYDASKCVTKVKNIPPETPRTSRPQPRYLRQPSKLQPLSKIGSCKPQTSISVPPGRSITRPSGLRSPSQISRNRFGFQGTTRPCPKPINSPSRSPRPRKNPSPLQNYSEQRQCPASHPKPPSPCRSPPRVAQPPQSVCEEESNDILNADEIQVDDYQPLSQLERIRMEIPLEINAGTSAPPTLTLRTEHRKVLDDIRPSTNEECLWQNEMSNAVCPEQNELHYEDNQRYIPKFEYKTPPKLKNPQVRKISPPFARLAVSRLSDGMISQETIEFYESPSPERQILSPAGAAERRKLRECRERELFEDDDSPYDVVLDEEQLEYEEMMNPTEMFSYEFMSELRKHRGRNMPKQRVPLEEKRMANLERRQNLANFPRVHRRRRGKTTRRCYGEPPREEAIKEYFEGPTEPIYESSGRRVPPIYPSVMTPPSAEKNIEVLPEAITIQIRANRPPVITRRPINKRQICPKKLTFDEEPPTPSPTKVAAEANRNRPRPASMISFKLGEYDFHISPPPPSLLNEEVPQKGLPRALIPYEHGWKSPPNMPTRKPLSPPKPTVIKIMPDKYINILDQEEFPYADYPPKIKSPYLATQARGFIDRLGTERCGFTPSPTKRNFENMYLGKDVNLECEELLLEDANCFLEECEKTVDQLRPGSPNIKTLQTVGSPPPSKQRQLNSPITIRIENGKIMVEQEKPRSPETTEFETLENIYQAEEAIQIKALTSEQSLSIEVEKQPSRTLRPSGIPKLGRLPRPISIPKPGGISRPSNVQRPGGVCPPGSLRPTGIPLPGTIFKPKAATNLTISITPNKQAGPSKISKKPMSLLKRPGATSKPTAKCRLSTSQSGLPPARCKLSKKQIPTQCKTPCRPSTSKSSNLATSVAKTKCRGVTQQKEPNARRITQEEINVSTENIREPVSNTALTSTAGVCGDVSSHATPPNIAARRLVLQRKLFKTFDELNNLYDKAAEEMYHEEGVSPLSQPLYLYRFREQVRQHRIPRKRRTNKRMNLQDMATRPIYEDPPNEEQCDYNY